MTLSEKCRQLPRITSTNGTIIQGLLAGCYEYPEDVKKFIEKAYELELLQNNYFEKYNKILETKYNELEHDFIYEELTLEELLTICTFIIRGERFIDGHIDKHLRAGIFQRVVDKLLELSKESTND